MKKNLKINVLITGLLCCAGCQEDFLEKLPLDQPAEEHFYSSSDELLLAVNAIYRDISFEIGAAPAPLESDLDAMTDIGFCRGSHAGIQETGNGSHDSQNGIFGTAWQTYYRGISRSNSLLQYMHRAQDQTDPALFARIEGEARFLRAYYYHRLVEFFGDVPFFTEALEVEEASLPRTAKSEIVDFLLTELDAAADLLPETYSGNDVGRATRGAALGLKARIALYNQRWEAAYQAAESVMDMNVYSLYPDYESLFTYAGEDSEEVIFSYRYLIGVNDHGNPQDNLTRMLGGWSVKVPSQAMIDSYECADGLTIDASPLYDPANPFENRDPRLDQSIIRPGSIFGGYRFETHPDSTTTRDYNNNRQVENQDVTNPFASFTGYNWKKYLDERDFDQRQLCELDWILMRYAEILLIYAEAKIEAGEIDQSVYDAVNAVRQRPSVEMPPVSGGKTQAELRRIIRRERKVELAQEGFRLFDIRRWGIAEKALNGPLFGRPKREYKAHYIPAFDEDGFPQYEYAADLRAVEQRKFNPARDYLWPIPQREMDINSNLVQNNGY